MKSNYLEIRKKALSWVKSKNASFDSGLSILQDSGYKPVAVANVARRGASNKFAVDKLRSLMFEFIRLWAKPEVEVKDEDVELYNDEPEEKNHQDVDDFCNEQSYPPIIRRAVHEFYALMKERTILHAKASGIEGNSDDNSKERNDLFSRVESISERMDLLWAIKTKYEENGVLPDESVFDNKVSVSEDNDEDNEDTDLSDFNSVEELKKLKKNTSTKIIRAKNMLDFQQVTKGESLNPMPDGPKRAKYEKKIESLKAFVEKIDYKIVELS